MEELIVIIMAGGLGKRMKSDIPKVLHNIDNKPMLVRVIENSLLLNPKKIMIVVGKYKNIIKNTIEQYISLDKIEFINQPNANGTGDAIKCCRNRIYEYKNHKVLILSGDVPLISSKTMIYTII